jgi:hypothetical protein
MTGKNVARLRNHCCRRRAITITYSECLFVVLVIEHGKRMRRIILLSVGPLAPPHFFALQKERHSFRE